MKLCYFKDGLAYFYNGDIKEVWGDDWNDVPYEHNAGEPYIRNEEDWTIVEVDEELVEQPYQYERKLNSSYSVEYINTGAVPWLIVNNEKIYAGTELEDFRRLFWFYCLFLHCCFLYQS